MKTSWPDHPVTRLRVLVLLTLFFIASGCGTAIHYENDIAAQKIVPAASTQVDVLGKGVDWKNSGVLVEKGNRYRVIAKGSWSAHPGNCGWQNADGDGFRWAGLCINWGGQDLPGYPVTTLVGKIGENGKPFKIGTEKTFTAMETGPLLFRMNDCPSTFYDNDGFITATTTNLDHTLASSKIPESLQTLPSQTLSGTGNRYAVFIGISDYADTRIPGLRYASADAKAFRDWSISQGGYAPAHIKTLVGRDATARNIRKALFEWLGQALQEDVVTIFFAGHGSPKSPDEKDSLYLLPYDTEYDSIAATAFPMWDIKTALKRHIKAKRVIVIADACHSGGVGESFDIARRAGRGMKVVPVSSGFEKLSNVQEGVCVITASGDNQLSQEGKQWGGGHGVFTHYLLKGLKGAADSSKDSKVTLGELTLYVSQKVRRATKNAQTPTVAGKYDPALTIGK